MRGVGPARLPGGGKAALSARRCGRHKHGDPGTAVTARRGGRACGVRCCPPAPPPAALAAGAEGPPSSCETAGPGETHRSAPEGATPVCPSYLPSEQGPRRVSRGADPRRISAFDSAVPGTLLSQLQPPSHSAIGACGGVRVYFAESAIVYN